MSSSDGQHVPQVVTATGSAPSPSPSAPHTKESYFGFSVDSHYSVGPSSAISAPPPMVAPSLGLGLGLGSALGFAGGGVGSSGVAHPSHHHTDNAPAISPTSAAGGGGINGTRQQQQHQFHHQFAKNSQSHDALGGATSTAGSLLGGGGAIGGAAVPASLGLGGMGMGLMGGGGLGLGEHHPVPHPSGFGGALGLGGGGVAAHTNYNTNSGGLNAIDNSSGALGRVGSNVGSAHSEGANSTTRLRGGGLGMGMGKGGPNPSLVASGGSSMDSGYDLYASNHTTNMHNLFANHHHGSGGNTVGTAFAGGGADMGGVVGGGGEGGGSSSAFAAAAGSAGGPPSQHFDGPSFLREAITGGGGGGGLGIGSGIPTAMMSLGAASGMDGGATPNAAAAMMSGGLNTTTTNTTDSAAASSSSSKLTMKVRTTRRGMDFGARYALGAWAHESVRCVGLLLGGYSDQRTEDQFAMRQLLDAWSAPCVTITFAIYLTCSLAVLNTALMPDHWWLIIVVGLYDVVCAVTAACQLRWVRGAKREYNEWIARVAHEDAPEGLHYALLLCRLPFSIATARRFEWVTLLFSLVTMGVHYAHAVVMQRAAVLSSATEPIMISYMIAPLTLICLGSRLRFNRLLVVMAASMGAGYGIGHLKDDTHSSGGMGMGGGGGGAMNGNVGPLSFALTKEHLAFSLTALIGILFVAAAKEDVAREHFRRANVVDQSLRTLQHFTRSSKRLLGDLVPLPILSRLLRGAPVHDTAKEVSTVCVDFCGSIDGIILRLGNPIVGAERLLVLIRELEDEAKKYSVDMANVTGDAFWGTCGLSDASLSTQHAHKMTNFAISVISWHPFRGVDIRIGLHSGPMASTILGTSAQSLDVVGAGTNITAEVAGATAPGTILATDAFLICLGKQVGPSVLHSVSNGFWRLQLQCTRLPMRVARVDASILAGESVSPLLDLHGSPAGAQIENFFDTQINPSLTMRQQAVHLLKLTRRRPFRWLREMGVGTQASKGGSLRNQQRKEAEQRAKREQQLEQQQQQKQQQQQRAREQQQQLLQQQQQQQQQKEQLNKAALNAFVGGIGTSSNPTMATVCMDGANESVTAADNGNNLADSTTAVINSGGGIVGGGLGGEMDHQFGGLGLVDDGSAAIGATGLPTATVMNGGGGVGALLGMAGDFSPTSNRNSNTNTNPNNHFASAGMGVIFGGEAARGSSEKRSSANVSAAEVAFDTSVLLYYSSRIIRIFSSLVLIACAMVTLIIMLQSDSSQPPGGIATLCCGILVAGLGTVLSAVNTSTRFKASVFITSVLAIASVAIVTGAVLCDDISLMRGNVSHLAIVFVFLWPCLSGLRLRFWSGLTTIIAILVGIAVMVYPFVDRANTDRRLAERRRSEDVIIGDDETGSPATTMAAVVSSAAAHAFAVASDLLLNSTAGSGDAVGGGGGGGSNNRDGGGGDGGAGLSDTEGLPYTGGGMAESLAFVSLCLLIPGTFCIWLEQYYTNTLHFVEGQCAMNVMKLTEKSRQLLYNLLCLMVPRHLAPWALKPYHLDALGRPIVTMNSQTLLLSRAKGRNIADEAEADEARQREREKRREEAAARNSDGNGPMAGGTTDFSDQSGGDDDDDAALVPGMGDDAMNLSFGSVPFDPPSLMTGVGVGGGGHAMDALILSPHTASTAMVPMMGGNSNNKSQKARRTNSKKKSSRGKGAAAKSRDEAGDGEEDEPSDYVPPLRPPPFPTYQWRQMAVCVLYINDLMSAQQVLATDLFSQIAKVHQWIGDGLATCAHLTTVRLCGDVITIAGLGDMGGAATVGADQYSSQNLLEVDSDDSDGDAGDYDDGALLLGSGGRTNAKPAKGGLVGNFPSNAQHRAGTTLRSNPNIDDAEEMKLLAASPSPPSSPPREGGGGGGGIVGMGATSLAALTTRVGPPVIASRTSPPPQMMDGMVFGTAAEEEHAAAVEEDGSGSGSGDSDLLGAGGMVMEAPAELEGPSATLTVPTMAMGSGIVPSPPLVASTSLFAGGDGAIVNKNQAANAIAMATAAASVPSSLLANKAGGGLPPPAASSTVTAATAHNASSGATSHLLSPPIDTDAFAEAKEVMSGDATLHRAVLEALFIADTRRARGGRASPRGKGFSMRTGLHVGLGAGTMLGQSRVTFDVFGPAMSTAMRIAKGAPKDRPIATERFVTCYDAAIGAERDRMMARLAMVTSAATLLQQQQQQQQQSSLSAAMGQKKSGGGGSLSTVVTVDYNDDAFGGGANPATSSGANPATSNSNSNAALLGAADDVLRGRASNPFASLSQTIGDDAKRAAAQHEEHGHAVVVDGAEAASAIPAVVDGTKVASATDAGGGSGNGGGGIVAVLPQQQQQGREGNATADAINGGFNALRAMHSNGAGGGGGGNGTSANNASTSSIPQSLIPGIMTGSSHFGGGGGGNGRHEGMASVVSASAVGVGLPVGIGRSNSNVSSNAYGGGGRLMGGSHGLNVSGIGGTSMLSLMMGGGGGAEAGGPAVVTASLAPPPPTATAAPPKQQAVSLARPDAANAVIEAKAAAEDGLHNGGGDAEDVDDDDDDGDALRQSPWVPGRGAGGYRHFFSAAGGAGVADGGVDPNRYHPSIVEWGTSVVLQQRQSLWTAEPLMGYELLATIPLQTTLLRGAMK